MQDINSLILILSLLVLTCKTEGFSPASMQHRRKSSKSILSAVSSETDDILKPKYEIESIPIRIGHGFDIHRMSPIEEAGQPVIIGGVEITHKDQKVRWNLDQKKKEFDNYANHA